MCVAPIAVAVVAVAHKYSTSQSVLYLGGVLRNFRFLLSRLRRLTFRHLLCKSQPAVSSLPVRQQECETHEKERCVCVVLRSVAEWHIWCD